MLRPTKVAFAITNAQTHALAFPLRRPGISSLHVSRTPNTGALPVDEPLSNAPRKVALETIAMTIIGHVGVAARAGLKSLFLGCSKDKMQTYIRVNILNCISHAVYVVY
jgi:hypothetical protein